MYKLISRSISKSHSSTINFTNMYKNVSKTPNRSFSILKRSVSEPNIKSQIVLDETVEEATTESNSEEPTDKSGRSALTKNYSNQLLPKSIFVEKPRDVVEARKFHTSSFTCFFSTNVTPNKKTIRSIFPNANSEDMYRKAMEQCIKIKIQKKRAESFFDKANLQPNAVRSKVPLTAVEVNTSRIESNIKLPKKKQVVSASYIPHEMRSYRKTVKVEHPKQKEAFKIVYPIRNVKNRIVFSAPGSYRRENKKMNKEEITSITYRNVIKPHKPKVQDAMVLGKLKIYKEKQVATKKREIPLESNTSYKSIDQLLKEPEIAKKNLQSLKESFFNHNNRGKAHTEKDEIKKKHRISQKAIPKMTNKIYPEKDLAKKLPETSSTLTSSYKSINIMERYIKKPNVDYNIEPDKMSRILLQGMENVEKKVENKTAHSVSSNKGGKSDREGDAYKTDNKYPKDLLNRETKQYEYSGNTRKIEQPQKTANKETEDYEETLLKKNIEELLKKDHKRESVTKTSLSNELDSYLKKLNAFKEQSAIERSNLQKSIKTDNIEKSKDSIQSKVHFRYESQNKMKSLPESNITSANQPTGDIEANKDAIKTTSTPMLEIRNNKNLLKRHIKNDRTTAKISNNNKDNLQKILAQYRYEEQDNAADPVSDKPENVSIINQKQNTNDASLRRVRSEDELISDSSLPAVPIKPISNYIRRIKEANKNKSKREECDALTNEPSNQAGTVSTAKLLQRVREASKQHNSVEHDASKILPVSPPKTESRKKGPVNVKAYTPSQSKEDSEPSVSFTHSTMPIYQKETVLQDTKTKVIDTLDSPIPKDEKKDDTKIQHAELQKTAVKEDEESLKQNNDEFIPLKQYINKPANVKVSEVERETVSENVNEGKLYEQESCLDGVDAKRGQKNLDQSKQQKKGEGTHNPLQKPPAGQKINIINETKQNDLPEVKKFVEKTDLLEETSHKTSREIDQAEKSKENSKNLKVATSTMKTLLKATESKVKRTNILPETSVRSKVVRGRQINVKENIPKRNSKEKKLKPSKRPRDKTPYSKISSASISKKRSKRNLGNKVATTPSTKFVNQLEKLADISKKQEQNSLKRSVKIFDTYGPVGNRRGRRDFKKIQVRKPQIQEVQKTSKNKDSTENIKKPSSLQSLKKVSRKNKTAFKNNQYILKQAASKINFIDNVQRGGTQKTKSQNNLQHPDQKDNQDSSVQCPKIDLIKDTKASSAKSLAADSKNQTKKLETALNKSVTKPLTNTIVRKVSVGENNVHNLKKTGDEGNRTDINISQIRKESKSLSAGTKSTNEIGSKAKTKFNHNTKNTKRGLLQSRDTKETNRESCTGIKSEGTLMHQQKKLQPIEVVSNQFQINFLKGSKQRDVIDRFKSTEPILPLDEQAKRTLPTKIEAFDHFFLLKEVTKKAKERIKNNYMKQDVTQEQGVQIKLSETVDQKLPTSNFKSQENTNPKSARSINNVINIQIPLTSENKVTKRDTKLNENTAENKVLEIRVKDDAAGEDIKPSRTVNIEPSNLEKKDNSGKTAEQPFIRKELPVPPASKKDDKGKKDPPKPRTGIVLPPPSNQERSKLNDETGKPKDVSSNKLPIGNGEVKLEGHESLKYINGHQVEYEDLHLIKSTREMNQQQKEIKSDCLSKQQTTITTKHKAHKYEHTSNRDKSKVVTKSENNTDRESKPQETLPNLKKSNRKQPLPTHIVRKLMKIKRQRDKGGQYNRATEYENFFNVLIRGQETTIQIPYLKNNHSDTSLMKMYMLDEDANSEIFLIKSKDRPMTDISGQKPLIEIQTTQQTSSNGYGIKTPIVSESRISGDILNSSLPVGGQQRNLNQPELGKLETTAEANKCKDESEDSKEDISVVIKDPTDKGDSFKEFRLDLSGIKKKKSFLFIFNPDVSEDIKEVSEIIQNKDRSAVISNKDDNQLPKVVPTPLSEAIFQKIRDGTIKNHKHPSDILEKENNEKNTTTVSHNVEKMVFSTKKSILPTDQTKTLSKKVKEKGKAIDTKKKATATENKNNDFVGNSEEFEKKDAANTPSGGKNKTKIHRLENCFIKVLDNIKKLDANGQLVRDTVYHVNNMLHMCTSKFFQDMFDKKKRPKSTLELAEENIKKPQPDSGLSQLTTAEFDQNSGDPDVRHTIPEKHLTAVSASTELMNSIRKALETDKLLQKPNGAATSSQIPKPNHEDAKVNDSHAHNLKNDNLIEDSLANASVDSMNSVTKELKVDQVLKKVEKRETSKITLGVTPKSQLSDNSSKHQSTVNQRVDDFNKSKAQNKVEDYSHSKVSGFSKVNTNFKEKQVQYEDLQIGVTKPASVRVTKSPTANDLLDSHTPNIKTAEPSPISPKPIEIKTMITSEINDINTDHKDFKLTQEQLKQQVDWQVGVTKPASVTVVHLSDLKTVSKDSFTNDQRKDAKSQANTVETFSGPSIQEEESKISTSTAKTMTKDSENTYHESTQEKLKQHADWHVGITKPASVTFANPSELRTIPKYLFKNDQREDITSESSLNVQKLTPVRTTEQEHADWQVGVTKPALVTLTNHYGVTTTAKNLLKHDQHKHTKSKEKKTEQSPTLLDLEPLTTVTLKTPTNDWPVGVTKPALITLTNHPKTATINVLKNNNRKDIKSEEQQLKLSPDLLKPVTTTKLKSTNYDQQIPQQGTDWQVGMTKPASVTYAKPSELPKDLFKTDQRKDAKSGEKKAETSPSLLELEPLQNVIKDFEQEEHTKYADWQVGVTKPASVILTHASDLHTTPKDLFKNDQHKDFISETSNPEPSSSSPKPGVIIINKSKLRTTDTEDKLFKSTTERLAQQPDWEVGVTKTALVASTNSSDVKTAPIEYIKNIQKVEERAGLSPGLPKPPRVTSTNVSESESVKSIQEQLQHVDWQVGVTKPASVILVTPNRTANESKPAVKNYESYLHPQIGSVINQHQNLKPEPQETVKRDSDSPAKSASLISTNIPALKRDIKALTDSATSSKECDQQTQEKPVPLPVRLESALQPYVKVGERNVIKNKYKNPVWPVGVTKPMYVTLTYDINLAPRPSKGDENTTFEAVQGVKKIDDLDSNSVNALEKSHLYEAHSAKTGQGKDDRPVAFSKPTSLADTQGNNIVMGDSKLAAQSESPIIQATELGRVIDDFAENKNDSVVMKSITENKYSKIACTSVEHNDGNTDLKIDKKTVEKAENEANITEIKTKNTNLQDTQNIVLAEDNIVKIIVETDTAKIVIDAKKESDPEFTKPGLEIAIQKAKDEKGESLMKTRLKSLESQLKNLSSMKKSSDKVSETVKIIETMNQSKKDTANDTPTKRIDVQNVSDYSSQNLPKLCFDESTKKQSINRDIVEQTTEKHENDQIFLTTSKNPTETESGSLEETYHFFKNDKLNPINVSAELFNNAIHKSDVGHSKTAVKSLEQLNKEKFSHCFADYDYSYTKRRARKLQEKRSYRMDSESGECFKSYFKSVEKRLNRAQDREPSIKFPERKDSSTKSLCIEQGAIDLYRNYSTTSYISQLNYVDYNFSPANMIFRFRHPKVYNKGDILASTELVKSYNLETKIEDDVGNEETFSTTLSDKNPDKPDKPADGKAANEHDKATKKPDVPPKKTVFRIIRAPNVYKKATRRYSKPTKPSKTLKQPNKAKMAKQSGKVQYHGRRNVILYILQNHINNRLNKSNLMAEQKIMSPNEKVERAIEKFKVDVTQESDSDFHTVSIIDVEMNKRKVYRKNIFRNFDKKIPNIIHKLRNVKSSISSGNSSQMPKSEPTDVSGAKKNAPGLKNKIQDSTEHEYNHRHLLQQNVVKKSLKRRGNPEKNVMKTSKVSTSDYQLKKRVTHHQEQSAENVAPKENAVLPLKETFFHKNNVLKSAAASTSDKSKTKPNFNQVNFRKNSSKADEPEKDKKIDKNGKKPTEPSAAKDDSPKSQSNDFRKALNDELANIFEKGPLDYKKHLKIVAKVEELNHNNNKLRNFNKKLDAHINYVSNSKGNTYEHIKPAKTSLNIASLENEISNKPVHFSFSSPSILQPEVTIEKDLEKYPKVKKIEGSQCAKKECESLRIPPKTFLQVLTAVPKEDDTTLTKTNVEKIMSVGKKKIGRYPGLRITYTAVNKGDAVGAADPDVSSKIRKKVLDETEKHSLASVRFEFLKRLEEEFENLHNPVKDIRIKSSFEKLRKSNELKESDSGGDQCLEKGSNQSLVDEKSVSDFNFNLNSNKPKNNLELILKKWIDRRTITEGDKDPNGK